ncbi:MAG: hypothetical protein JWN30_998 [Bacilli bacterium]|nr:hypothetical protein [Bacilli bacterium]
MKTIDKQKVQDLIQTFINQDIFMHLETTNGAYAAHRSESTMAVCAFIRNGNVRFHNGSIAGDGPYRVGLQMEQGWIYAEGLTDWELDDEGRLLLAGHDEDGRLAVSLELSLKPFRM